MFRFIRMFEGKVGVPTQVLLDVLLTLLALRV